MSLSTLTSPWKINFNPIGSQPFAMSIVIGDYVSEGKNLNHDIICIDPSFYSSGAIIGTPNIDEFFRGIVIVKKTSNNPFLDLQSNPKIFPTIELPTPTPTESYDILFSKEDLNVLSNTPSLRNAQKLIFKDTFLNISSAEYNNVLGPVGSRLTNEVWIISSFFADYIKSESFNQDLHQIAEVTHESLVVDLLAAADLSTTNFVLSNIGTINGTLAGKIKLDSNSDLFSGSLFVKDITGTNARIRLGLESDIVNNRIDTIYNNTLKAVNTPWKDTKINVIFDSKVVDSGSVSYSRNVINNNIVRYASILQFIAHYNEWQLGDASELYTATLATINPVGSQNPVRGELPSVLRTKFYDTDVQQTAGSIPFYDNTGADDRNLLQFSPDIKITKNGTEISLATNSFKAVGKNTNNGRQSVLDSNSLILGLDVNSKTTSNPTFLEFREQLGGYWESGTPAKVLGTRFELNDDTFSLRAFRPVNQDVSVNATVLTTYLDLLSFDFPDKNNTPVSIFTHPTLKIGQFSSNPGMSSGEELFTLKFHAEEFTFGEASVNNGIFDVWAISTFNRKTYFANDYSPIVDATPRQTLTITPNWDGSNAETSSYSIITSGRIASPSIDELWRYSKYIVSGGLLAESDTITSATLNYVLSSDVFDLIETILPGQQNTFKPSTAGVLWTKSINPLSLRELEAKLLYARYDMITFVNFANSRKVDKGNTQDDIGDSNLNKGTLYQLHKDELIWLNSTNTVLPIDFPDAINTYNIEDVYLSADGTWRYLFDSIRIPVLNE